MKYVLKFFSLFLCFVALLSQPIFASEPESKQVFSGTSATSYLLLDADTNVVLAERYADKTLPMASTTKIMTCILAIENGNLNDKVQITQESQGVEGSSVYLVAGEKLTLEELLYGLMLESANDAAVAIAIHIGGNVETFVQMMNKKAADIGMLSTHFCNAHGLPQEGHYSTARDMSRLMDYCMEDDSFCRFTSMQSCQISAPEGKKRFLSNHNKLLRSYDGCNGGKTGYTKTAGRCLVSAAERNGKQLICVTLSDPNDWKDHAALFDFGFGLYEIRELIAPRSVDEQISVVGGEMKTVAVCNQDGLSLPLRSEDKVEVVLELPNFVYAPIKSGDKVGDAVCVLNGEEATRIPLIATADIDEKVYVEKLSFWQKIWKMIKSWF